jgi:hypothetical protein
MGRASCAVREEVERFERGVLSIWAEYCEASRAKVSSLIAPSHDEQGPLEDFRAYIVSHKTSPYDVERAADFAWYLSHVMGPSAKARKLGTKLSQFQFMSGLELLEKLRVRRGAKLSFWKELRSS